MALRAPKWGKRARAGTWATILLTRRRRFGIVPDTKTMKAVSFLLLPSLLLLCSCAGTDWNRVLREVSQVALSEQDVANGLKDALLQGISKGAEEASRENGFLGNALPTTRPNSMPMSRRKLWTACSL